jgi:hypothetical protein
MSDSSRRTFLTGSAAAAASLAGGRVATASPSTAAPAESTAVLAAFSVVSGSGLTPGQIKTSQTYLVGVYRELDAKLRPLDLPDSLTPAVSFAAVKRR